MQRETPADEILRVGRVWQSTLEARGFRSPPSAIALFETQLRSTLDLAPGAAPEERFEALESFQTADGVRYQCKATGKASAVLRFGRKNEEAVLESTRSALKLPRNCQPAGFPEAELQIPKLTARFALRGDQLVAIEPPWEKRSYIPIE